MSQPEPGRVTQTRVVVTKGRTAGVSHSRFIALDRLEILVFETMTPVAQALIRAFRTFLQCLIAFIGLGLAGKPALAAVGVVIPPGDFMAVLWTAVGLALAPTVLALLQNLLEIVTKLDSNFPELRA